MLQVTVPRKHVHYRWFFTCGMLASGQTNPFHSIVWIFSQNAKACCCSPFPALSTLQCPHSPRQELKVKLRKNLALPLVVDRKLGGIWYFGDQSESCQWIPYNHLQGSVIKKSAAGPQAYRSNSSKMDLFPCNAGVRLNVKWIAW